MTTLDVQGKQIQVTNEQLNKSEFSLIEILGAREYWNGLSLEDLYFYWQHYTIGTGKGSYQSVKEDTSFPGYLVLSASESSFEKQYDI